MGVAFKPSNHPSPIPPMGSCTVEMEKMTKKGFSRFHSCFLLELVYQFFQITEIEYAYLNIIYSWNKMSIFVWRVFKWLALHHKTFKIFCKFLFLFKFWFFGNILRKMLFFVKCIKKKKKENILIFTDPVYHSLFWRSTVLSHFLLNKIILN